ncbi:hypothetical protein [Anaerolinea sp.]|uniref:hypothetical protein n=1 Tax=Anaerolinea sp. TaxID=1872519 RepID=UPI002ACEA187|nr:hypothetical protein [Anaerolinea sp.]
MENKFFSEQARMEAFCRDLAFALRRITGKVVELDPCQLPVPKTTPEETTEQEKPTQGESHE